MLSLRTVPRGGESSFAWSLPGVFRRLGRSLRWGAGWVALATAALAAEEKKILYPTTGAPVPPPVGGGLGSATLVVGLLLAAVGAWFVWRSRLASPRSVNGRKLALEETRSLGNRQYLVVASYEGKKLLLGVCPGRIDLIAPLHDEKPRA